MNNEALAALSAILPSDVVGGISDPHLARVSQAISRSTIAADRLNFGSAVSSEPVSGVMLLSDATVLKIPLPQSLALLAGGGPAYDGSFDDASCALPPPTMHLLHDVAQEPAPTCRRVAICIRLLSLPHGSVPVGVAQAVRRHLSTLLLRHPVLMHPGLLTPVAHAGRVEFMGVAAALSMSTHGGLPRYTDFHTGTSPCAIPDLDDQELVRALEQFSRHPCVRLALAGRTARIRASAEGGSYSTSPVVSQDSLPRTMLRTLGPRVQFLASVMETDEFAFPRFRAKDATLPFLSSIYASQRYSSQIAALLAQSTVAAFGAAHSHIEQGSSGWSAYYPRDAWLLRAIANRCSHLMDARTVGGFGGEFHANLAAAVPRQMFLSPSHALSPRVIERNVTAFVSGLCDAGLACSPEQARSTLLAWTIGTGRPATQLPRADVTAAVAFFNALDAHMASTSGPAIAHLAQIARDMAELDRLRVPGASAWETAAQLLHDERKMAYLLTRHPSGTSESRQELEKVSRPSSQHRP